MFEQPQLSPAGQRRRESILRLAKAAARRRRRRRKAAPAIVVGAIALMLTAVLVIRPNDRRRPDIVVHPSRVPLPSAVVVDVHPGSLAHKPRPVVITIIQTEHGLTDRLAIPSQPRSAWRRLTDDELIQQLANAGHPAGLAWVDGRETLLFEDRHDAQSR